MAKKPSYLLLGSVGALIIAGIIILASVSAPFSLEKTGTPYYFLNHQLFFGLIPGLLLGAFAYFIKLSFLRKLAPILLLINVGLLILVFVPHIGVSAWGAARWIKIGPLSFQPSEFLKVFFILYLASFLASREKALKIFLTIIGTASILLIFQPDISTLGIVVLTALIMYFLSQTPIWHTFLIFLVGATGLTLLIKFAAYRFARLAIFFNPDLDPMGQGYQIKQALMAIGSGGILGQGLGMSSQKLGLLPQPMSDSIFAVFAEEAGFLGAAILLSIFILFLYAGLRVVKNSRDKFSQLAASGITCWIILQTFINISSMVGIFPLSGIPLPFIGYGGSALISELMAMGILLNISKNNS